MQYGSTMSADTQITRVSAVPWLNKSAATLLAALLRRTVGFRFLSLALLFLLTLPAAPAGAEVFSLGSVTVSDGDRIPTARLYMGSSCSGENISPELHWRDAPQGTRSFALTMYDPDAGSGNGRWHWVVFNIPAESTSLPEGAGEPKSGLIPEAIQARTDFRGYGYSGACPPEGTDNYRYQFRIYALKVDLLPLDETSPAGVVADHINANKLAEAQLDVIYGR
jgi:Raf kinase inhibitor-like YbhB/YbcL family protein